MLLKKLLSFGDLLGCILFLVILAHPDFFELLVCHDDAVVIAVDDSAAKLFPAFFACTVFISNKQFRARISSHEFSRCLLKHRLRHNHCWSATHSDAL